MDRELCVVIIAVVSIWTWAQHSPAQGRLSRLCCRLGSLEADSETEASAQVFPRTWLWDQVHGQGDKESEPGRGKLDTDAQWQLRPAPWKF